MLFEAPGPWNEATRYYEITAEDSEDEVKLLEALYGLLKTRSKGSTIISAKFYPSRNNPRRALLQVTHRLMSRKEQIARYSRIVESK